MSERRVATKLKPGDTVRVIGSRRTAKIRAILAEMHGALLESEIDGFRCWNLDELRLVKRGKATASGKLWHLRGRLSAKDIVSRAPKRKRG